MEKPKEIFRNRNLPQFNIIIHLACKVGWGKVTLNEMLVPNVIATKEIANFALEQGAFFIFSSAAVVHGSRSSFITLQSPLSCDTPYAESKAMAENEIQKALSDYCILRFGGIFWKKGPPHLGLNRAIDEILAGLNPAYVASGKARRNYISVNDAARIIASICRQKNKGVHLCAGSSALSIKTMLDRACEILNPLICSPKQIEGPEAQDQIIEVSHDLPVSGSFEDAMREILS